jgi:ferredoxin
VFDDPDTLDVHRDARRHVAFDEDGIVVLLTDNPSDELATDVHQAAAVCPALAIVVED